MKFLPISSFFVFVLVAFNFVSAQQASTNITSTCEQELTKLFQSSDLNSCSSFNMFFLQDTSLDSYCSALKCNDNTISADVTEIKSQCATDLAAKDSTVTFLKNFFVFNSPIRDSLCFKNSSGGYCDSASILDYISGMNATLPTDITCNDCDKAIINTFVNYFKAHPESVADLPADPASFKNSVTTKCGASFLDFPKPADSKPADSKPTDSIDSSTTTTSSAKSGGISMHAPSFIGFTMFANSIIVASFIILIAYAI
ncbi:hypothetical protein C2G38_1041709 [Gigaspora rosea]|uniref:Transmembrane protein n=1 Tax=Gigaspora rosea TaxID=44941 RepID=A0A397W4F9_9GLOM|nr:hypothetical protein C2G38_1041709 [Gigaspora rosea]